MPDQKISQLTGGGAAQATDEIPIARSGSNFKLTGADIAAAATSVGTLTSLTVNGAASIRTLAASGQSLTGTQATSLVDLAATWNTTGTPTLIKANVTDTASNANSLLMDLQTGGVSRLRVDKNGSLTLINGGNNTFINRSWGIEVQGQGTTVGGYTNASVYAVTNFALGTPIDAFIYRDAANTIAQRNGVNAQTFRVYNTFTDASNYERTAITSATHSGAKYQQLLAESAGTGAANLGVVIQPKGTGAFSLQMPDGTTTGGNARGSRAVDLTLARGLATQVASGANSFAIGQNATASGSSSVALGDGATASGFYALAGPQSSATNSYATAFGQGATASALSTFAANSYGTASAANATIFGYYGTSSGTAAFACGAFAAADKYGQFAVGLGPASGSTTANAQWSVVGFRGQTTDATITEIFLHGVSNTRATVPASRTWVAEVDVIARSTGGTSNACFKRRCIIKRDGANNTALVGSVETIGTDIGSNAGVPPTGWAVTITADDTNESLKVEVTGAASTTINWVAKASLVEVGLA